MMTTSKASVSVSIKPSIAEEPSSSAGFRRHGAGREDEQGAAAPALDDVVELHASGQHIAESDPTLDAEVLGHAGEAEVAVEQGHALPGIGEGECQVRRGGRLALAGAGAGHDEHALVCRRRRSARWCGGCGRPRRGGRAARCSWRGGCSPVSGSSGICPRTGTGTAASTSAATRTRRSSVARRSATPTPTASPSSEPMMRDREKFGATGVVGT